MILATWFNKHKTLSVTLTNDGTVVVKERNTVDDVWSPPSEKLTLEAMTPEFREMLELVRNG